MKTNFSLKKCDISEHDAKLLLMMIAPNSRARKGVKKRGEVKGKYG